MVPWWVSRSPAWVSWGCWRQRFLWPSLNLLPPCDTPKAAMTTRQQRRKKLKGAKANLRKAHAAGNLTDWEYEVLLSFTTLAVFDDDRDSKPYQAAQRHIVSQTDTLDSLRSATLTALYAHPRTRPVDVAKEIGCSWRLAKRLLDGLEVDGLLCRGTTDYGRFRYRLTDEGVKAVAHLLPPTDTVLP